MRNGFWLLPWIVSTIYCPFSLPHFLRDSQLRPFTHRKLGLFAFVNSLPTRRTEWNNEMIFFILKCRAIENQTSFFTFRLPLRLSGVCKERGKCFMTFTLVSLLRQKLQIWEVQQLPKERVLLLACQLIYTSFLLAAVTMQQRETVKGKNRQTRQPEHNVRIPAGVRRVIPPTGTGTRDLPNWN